VKLSAELSVGIAMGAAVFESQPDPNPVAVRTAKAQRALVWLSRFIENLQERAD
jgi:hypothetical protein